MPEAESYSWAEQVEAGEDGALPPPTEEFNESSGIKTVKEYKHNEDGKVVKVSTRERRKAPKSIAIRKTWRKFGAAERDPPGPNTSNTIVQVEPFYMQFIHNAEQVDQETEEDPLAKLKNQKLVSCRICKGDHWTTKCPYKDTLAPLQEKLQEGEKTAEAPGGAPGTPAPAAASAQPKTGKYVPPSLREGGSKGRGETMQSKRDESATIRVTNLSEDTREPDLQELFRPFGPIQRIYLAKDKNTGVSKGFAFINFHRREDAARAIAGVSGFGYDHLILNVEWAKPSGTN
ncbi:hypothetical protein ScPMuIL_010152 [Solemya velum]